MNIVHKILNSSLSIMKGEGIYRVDPETGEPVFIGMPRPEMVHSENNPLKFGFDLPLHAHLGDRTPSGNWKIGPHGDMVWEDQFGHHHRHGIDGVANMLGKIGVKDPAGMINEAIKITNENHTLGEKAHMPQFNDPAWRKLRYHSYSPSHTVEDAYSYPYNGGKGTLATVNLSSAAKATASGQPLDQHPESYRIGFAPVLRTLIEAAGLQVPKFMEGLTHSYISGRFLSDDPTGTYQQPVKRLRSKFGENLNPDNTLSPEHAQHIGAKTNAVAPFQEGVHTWEMMPVLPKILSHPSLMQHYKETQGKGGGGKKAKHTIYTDYLSSMADQMIANTDPEILDTPLIAGDPPTTLRSALESDTERMALVASMMKSPGALSFLLGNPENEGPAKWLLGHIEKKMLEGLDTEGMAAYQNALQGVTGGKTKHTQDKHGHDLAARLFAMAHVVDSEKLANFSMDDMPPADQELIEQQSRIFDVVAHSLAQAHGHQPNRALTAMEEIPAYDQVTMPRGLAGAMTGGNLPQHIADNMVASIEELPQPLVQTQGVPDDADEDRELWEASAKMTPEQRKRIYAAAQSGYPERNIPAPVLAERPEHQLSTFAQNLRAGQELTGETGMPMSEDEIRERFFQLMRQQLGSTQTRLTDFQSPENPPIATSFDTVSVEDRLIKAMERMQMLDAKQDMAVLSQAITVPLNKESEDDLSFLAMKMGITKQDVRSIAHSKGDWHRIAKAYDIKPIVVKAVKVSLEEA